MFLRSWTLFALLVGGAACLPAATFYTVTDIGALSGLYTLGNGINNAGQVTGYYFQPRGYGQGFLYSNGVMTDLGTLTGSRGSIGDAINNAGQITGTFGNAFLYSNGVTTDLGRLPGTAFSEGHAINNGGQVAGESYYPYVAGSTEAHAFFYSNGVMTDLGTLGGLNSRAYGINDAGQITGQSDTANGAVHVFLYSNGVMTDLGPGTGRSINNAGQITGSNGYAFLYSNGVMADLGTLGGFSGSSGEAINNAGQITGNSGTASGAQHAFLYSDGVMTDLNSLIDPNLQITLNDAISINDLGQIVANTYHHVYLLTPVPEPGTWLLLVAALARSYTR